MQNERLSATLSSGNPPLARSVGYYYGKDTPSKVPLLKSNKLFTNWRILEFVLNGNLTGSRDNGACVPGKACAVATAANQYPGWLTFFFFQVQKGYTIAIIFFFKKRPLFFFLPFLSFPLSLVLTLQKLIHISKYLYNNHHHAETESCIPFPESTPRNWHSGRSCHCCPGRLWRFS